MQRTAHASIVKYALAACAVFAFCAPANVNAEYIGSFASDIEVHQDSSLEVTETITYAFTEERHGIYRCIPHIHSEPASSIFKKRVIDVEYLSVLMDGVPAPYAAMRETGSECIRIGDADSLIKGTHVYTIVYAVRGGLTYIQNGGADLYWNVNGSGWDVPVRAVSATVSSPDGVLIPAERSCYLGSADNTLSCTVEDVPGGAVTFSGTDLSPHDEMTIALAVNRNVVRVVELERLSPLASGSALIVLLIVSLMIFWYRHSTQYVTSGPIIAQYVPYEDIKPMYAGYIFDRKLDPRDITAGIMYLAREGFLGIKRIDKKVFFVFDADDHEITLKRPIQDAEGSFEKKLLELFFVREAKVGDRITLSELKENDPQQALNMRHLRDLKAGLAKDIVMKGFFTQRKSWSAGIALAVPVMIVITIWSFVELPLYASAAVLIGWAAIIAIAIAGSSRRTQKGYETLDHLKGFREFLSVTESERYTFHNAPSKSPEQFMEYLPYAIAFGVEEEWAETFKDVTIPSPDWYEGSAHGQFDARMFTRSFDNFSVNFSQSASGSSLGGWRSSGGGGRAGGGSGGGGGGSW